MTIRDQYPLPRTEDIFDAMVGAKIFSKMDAESGFHQVDLEQGSKIKTAFGVNSEYLNTIKCHSNW